MDESTTIFDKSVDEYVKGGMTNMMRVMKLAVEMKGLQQYSDYPGVNRLLSTINSSLTKLIQDIYYHQDVSLNLRGENLETQMEMLRDGNDCLMERINSELDEAQGIRRTGGLENLQPSANARILGTPRNNQNNHSGNRAADSASSNPMMLLASRTFPKPQLFFEEKVDNSAKTPFMPIITEKPNSKKPLAIMLCRDEDGNDFYSHPYEYEINHFIPDEEYLKSKLEPVVPASMEDTPLLIIDTETGLTKSIEEMKGASHIAVDVEHHSFRSYLGLTSLIQISTANKDYIIDPLKLRGKLQPLNEIFTHPKIVKVLHGADHDVLWLQRDCGLYLVNMFDTHLAAVTLEFPERSLAALLQHFCKVQTDKRYQRADWRIRPLPSDFIQYARMDTHYLLYIHHCLHNMLIDKSSDNSLMRTVYENSSQLCLQRYEKPVVGPDSYLALYRRSRKLFDNRQEYALRELFLWRDKVARDHDESVDFVLARHMLLQIAEVLPKEMQGILACCNPIPYLVKTELLAIHNIIKTARDQPLHKTVLPRPEAAPSISLKSGGSNYCLHDMSQMEDEENLPCLLDDKSTNQESMFGDLFQEKKIEVQFKKCSDLFGKILKAINEVSQVNKTITSYLSPYDRYIRYKIHKDKLPQFETKPQENSSAAASVDDADQLPEDDDRVLRVREHFLALMGPSPAANQEQQSVIKNSFNDDAGRMARLFSDVQKSIARPNPYEGSSVGTSDVDGMKKKVAVIKTITFDGSSGDDSSSSDSSDSESSDSEPNTQMNIPDNTDTKNTSSSSSSDSDSTSNSPPPRSTSSISNTSKDSKKRKRGSPSSAKVSTTSATSKDSSSSSESSEDNEEVSSDDSSSDEFEEEKLARQQSKKQKTDNFKPFNYEGANFKIFSRKRGRGNKRGGGMRNRGGGRGEARGGGRGRGGGGGKGKRGGRGKN